MEDDRIEKHMQKAGVSEYLLYRPRHTRACVSVWACRNELGWVAATYRQDVFCLEWKYENSISDSPLCWRTESLLINFSPSLSNFHLQRESRDVFVCIFSQKSSPAAHIYFSWQSSLNSYSRVMFLQLFRHRHCVAMSQSPTRHSAALIHRQAPHSML